MNLDLFNPNQTYYVKTNIKQTHNEAVYLPEERTTRYLSALIIN